MLLETRRTPATMHASTAHDQIAHDNGAALRRRVQRDSASTCSKFTPSGGLIHVALEADGPSARLRGSATGVWDPLELPPEDF